MIQKTNAKDVRCVSWILRNITDPEALDAAIRFAGTIRWFEDGIDAEAPYHAIVSTFHSCLDSTGIVYPGSRDRAYFSAQAILWIHIRAMCVSEEFAGRLPLPSTRNHISYDLDLNMLLRMYEVVGSPVLFAYRGVFMELNSPAYMRWASNAFLHFCWTKQGNPDALGPAFPYYNVEEIPWDTIPLDATLNLFLVWSIYLGHSVEEGMLRIQDKAYDISRSLPRITKYLFSSVCLEQVISQLSRAIVTAIPASHPRHPLVRTMLLELAKWENRPNCLRELSYKWCSTISKGYQGLEDGEELLFLSLKVGFRGLNVRYHSTMSEG